MRSLLLCSAIAGLAIAHGSHSQKPIVDPNANWMTKHMAGEFPPPPSPRFSSIESSY